MKALLLMMTLSIAAPALAASNCRDLFKDLNDPPIHAPIASKKLHAEDQLAQMYPVRDLSGYLAKKDLGNYLEAGRADIARSDRAMLYDLIRQNHAFENLQARLNKAGRITFNTWNGVVGEITPGKTPDEIKVKWRTSSKNGGSFVFVRESLEESFEKSGDPQYRLTLERKAGNFGRLTETEDGNWAPINGTAFEVAYSIGLDGALSLNGAPIERLDFFNNKRETLRLNRLMALLPKNLPAALKRVATIVEEQGKQRGANQIVELSWGTVSLKSATKLTSDQFTLDVHSQALDMKVVTNLKTDEITIYGVFDKYTMDASRAHRSFVIKGSHGSYQMESVGGENGFEYRTFSDLFDVFAGLDATLFTAK